MKEEQEHEHLNRWLNGEIDENEVSQLLSATQIQKYKQILNSVDQLIPTNEAFVFDPALVTHLKKQPITKSLNWWIPLSAAASFLVLMIVGFYYFEDSNVSYQTAFGEKKNLMLPDESTSVVLAANSEIKLNEEDWSSTGQRSLELSGQAYFDVPQKGDFQVNTTLGAISVLGTRFEVVSHDDLLEVKCYEGVVSVTVGQMPALILNAGEGSLYNQNQWEEKQVLLVNQPSWIAKLETFNKAPLKQVLKYLNAQYNVNFDIGAIDIDRRFTGTVPDDNLTLALKIVFSSLDIQYKQKDEVIILSE